MTRVKICGVTSVADAHAAIEAGADAIGLILAPSPRCIDPGVAAAIAASMPPFVTPVGVFVDAEVAEVVAISRQIRLNVVQLHGEESPSACDELRACGLRIIKRIAVRADSTTADVRASLRPYRIDGVLLDPGAGSGIRFDWRIARELTAPVIVAGGLNPANVADAIRAARPCGVDVASGVEQSPGVKDVEKMRAFVRAVRQADAGN